MLKRGPSQAIIILHLLIQAAFCQNKAEGLTFSEVMFSPAAANSEFVEIYNTSSTDTIDLSGLAVQYMSSTPDTILQTGAAALLPPRSFAIIFEGDYDYLNGIYKDLTGKSALVLKIRSTAFGSSGMSNTSGRTMVLTGLKKDTLDIYTYSADNEAGISDEKIILEAQNSPFNWANSVNRNGTPGGGNSVLLNAWKLEIDSAKITPPNPEQNEDVSFSALVLNKGFLAVNGLRIFCFYDADMDSTGTENELIGSAEYSEIQPGKSVKLFIYAGKFSSGIHRLLLKGEYENQNGGKFELGHLFTFQVVKEHAKKYDVVINEIMYAPLSGEPEWVELTNRSAGEIDLRKWKIADNVSKATVSAAGRILQPGAFLILTSDSAVKSLYSITSEVIQISLPSLNNNGDAVVLCDSAGRTIDSVAYSPLWGGSKGTSLERISADLPSFLGSSWKSPEGKIKATPGCINSVTPRENDLSINAESRPGYIFTGEAAIVRLIIKNTGRRRSPEFTVMIFRLMNEDSSANTGEIIWQTRSAALEPGDSSYITAVLDGLNEGKNLLAARIFSGSDDRPENDIEIFNIAGIRINEQRGDLVINEIMYAPAPGKCEWIELYNSSSRNILFSRYQTANHADTSFLEITPQLIHPSEYLVIGRDSSVLSDYAIPGLFFAGRFPTLSNDGDMIIILDSLSRVIDSVRYTPGWGGGSGNSIERISPSAPSSDQLNWKSAAAPLTGTPGKRNSVSPLDFDPAVKRFYFSPPRPAIDDSISFTAEIKNCGLKTSRLYAQLYECNLIDSSAAKMPGKSGVFELAPGDSVLFTFPFRLYPPLTETLAAVRIFPEYDDNSSNNSLFATIIPGIGKGALLINEIMYAPSGGEPEWIELFNNGDFPLSLKRCSTADESVPLSLHKITDKGIYAGPKQFLILAADSSFFNFHPAADCPVIIADLPALNNDKDAVVIKDINRVTVDSLYYASTWGGTGGYSLERISAVYAAEERENWGQCRDPIKSTPGLTNSLSRKDFDLELSEILFNPDSASVGEMIGVSVKIKNTGKKDQAGFTIIAHALEYNSGSQYLIGKLDNLFLKAEDSAAIAFAASFSLRSSTLVSVQIISVTDQDSSNNRLSKVITPAFTRGIILINEVMHDPAGSEPEWIELINNSAIPVNLKDWYISVSTAQYKAVISEKDLITGPGEMVVIARDSALKSFYPGVSFRLSTSRFRQLGNNGEIISIYDHKNNLIDSLKFKYGWHKIMGRSMERFSLTGKTSDSCTWAPCTHRMRATPGSPNSAIGLSSYKRNSLIINEVLYNPAEGNSEFIELYNSSDGITDIAGWQIYQKSGDYFTLSDSGRKIQPGDYFVLASDSALFPNYSHLNSSGRCSISGRTLSFLKEGDRIVLKDARGNVIDSLYYFDKWHSKPESATKNISLERYSPRIETNLPDNWHSSYSSAGATPAAPNSIKPPDVNGRSGFSISPNPFSPDNDGFEDITHIDIDTGSDVDAVRVRIFNSNGILVRTLYSKSPGEHLTIDFNGRNEQGEALRIGIYILLIEKIKAGSAPSEAIKSVVVIARKL